MIQCERAIMERIGYLQRYKVWVQVYQAFTVIGLPWFMDLFHVVQQLQINFYNISSNVIVLNLQRCVDMLPFYI
jgi:hypothetical protein